MGYRSSNIVEAQASLEGFYNFVFLTLATLITLIAPALTAASVVGERQRQSFDLLVTTPLTAGHLLIGKLLSSIAFLGMLLLLSLPASALCILLGGATLADVFRAYLLLAVDGVILSAIGLYFSCAVRVPLLATIWTYVAVLGYVIVSLFISSMVSVNHNSPPLELEPFLSVTWLNPFLAILPVSNGEGTAPILLLRLVVYLGLAVFLVRLLLNAATYRLGLFGAQSGFALRRQALLLSGILSWFVSHAASTYAFEAGKLSIDSWLPPSIFLPMLAFLMVLPFLPGLFVPATADDAPPGAVSESADDPTRHRLFVARRLFNPEHSGALPWYTAFVATVALGFLLGAAGNATLFGYALLITAFGSLYMLTLGYLVWALSRLASTLVRDLSSARATAFALFVAISGLPVLLFTMTNTEWKDNMLAPLWLFSPLLFTSTHSFALEAMVRSGAVALAIGIFVFLFDRGLRQAKTGALTP
jgi:ABC-type transport system involved in multi-copper enzyme maturation permease subunit